MNWDKFKDRFHPSWHHIIRPFIESKECDNIYKVLKEEKRRIVPSSFLTFRCFKETPLTDLKVVLLGMCPYHTVSYGKQVADGLLMGCSVTERLQPTLENFYEGIETELYGGFNLNYDKNPDVSYLAKQGVLMLNSALTTVEFKAGAHQDLWMPFTKYIFEKVIIPGNIPVIYLGRDAQIYMGMRKAQEPNLFNPDGKKIEMELDFPLSHPASASYNAGKWSTKDVFQKVDELLYQTKGESIQWLDTEMPF